jgi:hypothetical protein
MESLTQNINDYNAFVKTLAEKTGNSETMVHAALRSISDAILTKIFETPADPIKILELKIEILNQLQPLEKEAKQIRQQIDFFHYILKFVN